MARSGIPYKNNSNKGPGETGEFNIFCAMVSSANSNTPLANNSEDKMPNSMLRTSI